MATSLSELWGPAAGEDIPSTLERFHKAIVQYPDNIALVCTHQSSDLYGIHSTQPHPAGSNGALQSLPGKSGQYLRWTFRDLKAGVDRLVSSLKSLGVREGTAIVTLLPNGAEFSLLWWAAMELGAVMAPLDSRRLQNQEEVAHMLATIAKGIADKQEFLFVSHTREQICATIIASHPALARVVVQPEPRFHGDDILAFSELMESLEQMASNDVDRPITTLRRFGNETTDSCIVFTSGSTSLPKGVKRCYPLQSLIACEVFVPAEYDTVPGDLWCASAPNNHSVGTATLISPMTAGAGTLFAGPRFSAEATAEALVREPCTHMLLVPSMVNLLADALTDTGNKGQTQLKAIMVAGSPPTRSVLERCFDVLGASGVCIRYGSTEGIACNSPVASNVEALISADGQVSSGMPARGTGVKICDPNDPDPEHPPLPRGQPGEIHFSAPFSEQGLYVGRVDTDDVCYADRNGKRWFISGDQGIISTDGRLSVVGRYKDMIIRGGENISPLTIETCLAGDEKLAGEIIHIVGRPDNLSGEVPVAVVSGDADVKAMAKEIHRVTSQSMGPLWIPEEVISLKTLGLEDWPKTALGKINKRTLREHVGQHQLENMPKPNGVLHANEVSYANEISHEESASHADESSHKNKFWRASEGVRNGAIDWRQHVLNIWAGVLGLEATDVPVDSPVLQIADSLMLARVRGQVRREVAGQEKLSLRDLTEAVTISGQIEVIMSRMNGKDPETAREHEAQSQQSSPGVASMVGQRSMLIGRIC